ncbi:hypothetical protein D7U36_08890 [Propionibacterium australiense]|uniref:Uncharacterized protein n=1 Tax=Propionibacterium australiense TaxID=119981 RepID=A0A8B3FIR0_9ACTN|nr:hypothetical protein D7U36_08890 [Propionibacterium australiense]
MTDVAHRSATRFSSAIPAPSGASGGSGGMMGVSRLVVSPSRSAPTRAASTVRTSACVRAQPSLPHHSMPYASTRLGSLNPGV